MASKSTLKKETPVSQTIFLGLITSILFIESIYILTRAFTKGVLKKEVLTTKNNMGFDFKIIMRE